MEHSVATAPLSAVTHDYAWRPNEASFSGVSWAAVLGGAFIAAALSVVLLALGSGLGLSSVSPWANTGASASTMGVATIVWLVVMQIIAFAMGGYLAGRLRTKWVDVHTDEVFFRDTAHGFLVWAVGIVISGAFLASAASSMLGGAAKAGLAGAAITGAAVTGKAALAGASQSSSTDTQANAYLTDLLFRRDASSTNSDTNPSLADASSTVTRSDATPKSMRQLASPNTARANGGQNSPRPEPNVDSIRPEVGRILEKGLSQDQFPAADQTYLAKQVAARTGLSQADAEARVADIIAQAKKAEADARQAADQARKVAAHASLWMFLSLLIGAFCACYAATIGGRQRDHVMA